MGRTVNAGGSVPVSWRHRRRAPWRSCSPRREFFPGTICKKLNQRVNLDDEQRVLGLYERGWIFKGVLGNLNDGEARYVRALATRYGSWIARQVA